MTNISVPYRVRSVGHRRYLIMLLLLLLVTINYIDRANLAVAGPQMAREFGWSPAVLGVVFSAMFWIYAPGLLLWGALLDVVGTRLACAVGLVVWAAASVATGAVNGFASLLSARLALGVGESVMPPACAKVVREWAPARERGWATGVFTAGYYAGPAIGFPICAWLVSAVGWRAMFYVLGGATFVFFFLWLFAYYRPEQAKWLAEDEREMIVAERDTVAPQIAIGPSITRLDLLRHPTTWGLVVAQASSTYTVYLFLTWLPGYLLKAKHLNLAQMGGYSAIPFVTALFATIVSGWLSDRLLSARTRDRGGRRIHVVVSMLAAMAILLVPATDNFALTMFLLAVALAGSGCALMANVSLANDLLVDPRFAGLLFGLLGIGSNLLGLFSPMVTGVVAQVTGHFAGAFLVAGTLSAIGIACVLTLVRKPITVP